MRRKEERITGGRRGAAGLGECGGEEGEVERGHEGNKIDFSVKRPND